MIRAFLTSLLLLVAGASASSAYAGLPKGFVYARDIIPNVVLDLRYAGTNNFVAAPVDGYEASEAILSIEAAAALKAVSRDLAAQGYALKVFDAYRPARAVRHFVRWGKDLKDVKNKAAFYPAVDKTELFARGYIASRSGHSRGSTVDLTIVDLKTGREIDMGSGFDLFDPISHHGARGITAEQTANRNILRHVMERHGFSHLNEEWWHYSLKNAPHAGVYFDFPVAAPSAVDARWADALDARAAGADRMIVVSARADNPTVADIRAFERRGGQWRQIFATDGRLGRSGFRADKKEGDGGTPTGTYGFGRAFGVAADPGSNLPYTRVGERDVWVDDPASKFYNQWARAGQPGADWKSAEKLASYRDAYKYALTINFNTAPVVPGRGSAIFLHVATGKPTAGCVAVPEAAMVFFLGFVKADTKIVLAS